VIDARRTESLGHVGRVLADHLGPDFASGLLGTFRWWRRHSWRRWTGRFRKCRGRLFRPSSLFFNDWRRLNDPHVSPFVPGDNLETLLGCSGPGQRLVGLGSRWRCLMGGLFNRFADGLNVVARLDNSPHSLG
jgi:hypothetical protein